MRDTGGWVKAIEQRSAGTDYAAVVRMIADRRTDQNAATEAAAPTLTYSSGRAR
jgi:hypothetical protein